MARARVQIRDGWVEVPYSGDDLSRVEIGVGSPTAWRPAFLDYDDAGQRVAKVRAAVALPATVLLRVDGAETVIGTLR